MSNPSLILPQSPAYGEDYVYAAQVEDGAVPLYNVLPLTFTRASGGTRINKDGLVQNMPYNLASYSNTFNNGVWVTGGYGNLPALTANAIANPVNGATDAWSATFTSSGTQGRLLQLFTGLTIGLPYTYSMYVKAGSKTSVSVYSDTATIGLNANFNLSNGTITSTSGVTATITAISNGWYFITITNNILPSGNGQYGIVTNTGDDGSMYIYGAQLNIGSTAQPYLATTDRLNMPRITYPVGGGCGALLLEKQSTNIALYSEDFSNGVYILSSTSVSANTTISPDGTQNADSVIFGSYGIIEQSITYSAANQTHTISVWAKVASGTAIFRLKLTHAGVANYYSPDLTATTQWQRFTFTQAFGSGGTGFYAGVSIDSVGLTLQLWGLQLEPNTSYATSYIPTTSTSVTRIADACYKTGISNLIGQSEGVIFVDFVVVGIGSNNINIYNNDRTASTISTNAILFKPIGSIECQTFLGNGTFNTISITASTYTVGQRIKLAYRYKSGDFALYINGIQKATATNTMTFVGTKSQMYLDDNAVIYAYQESVQYNNFIQFPTALTNAELQALTTI